MAGWKGRPGEFRQLWGYSVGFYGVWVAHVGRRLGLFGEIACLPQSAAGLAKKTGMDAGAVAAWCSAAEALGFVHEKGGKLHMSKKMQEVLLDGKSPDYLGGQFSYIAMRSLEYGSLEDLFRSGTKRDMAATFEKAAGCLMSAVAPARSLKNYGRHTPDLRLSGSSRQKLRHTRLWRWLQASR
jgi:hypothetical protein